MLRATLVALLTLGLVLSGNAQSSLDKTARAWVETTLKKMSLEQIVGQMMFAPFQSTYLSSDTDDYDELVKLARGAWRLYCDSYYARKEAKNAATHRHMMAHQSGELARLAKVEQLVLIHFAPRYAGRYQMLVAEAAEVFPRVGAEIGERGA